MLKKLLRLTITLVFTATGLLVAEYSKSYVSSLINYNLNGDSMVQNMLAVGMSLAIGVLLFGGIGYLLSPILIKYLMKYSEAGAAVLTKLPTEDIVTAAIGVVIGLIVANLFGAPFSNLPVLGKYIPIVINLVFALVGAKVALSKRVEVVTFFNRKLPALMAAKASEKKVSAARVSCNYKILDTSVLIDGRMADIVNTGFLDGPIVIPSFVVEELQKVADSADTLKRNKGRRGLDVVKKIQENKLVEVQISNKDYEDVHEVDTKLLMLAKEIGGVVATNDFNLSKVADIQGVRVLNINDLANSVKPAVLPGEELQVFLAKEGKEYGQAIAYLEDGTMIVVESGRQSVNSNVTVVVTSVLQTSSGRMIFAKMK